MLKRAFGGLPPCYFAGDSSWTIQFRDKNALAADEKSDKWRQVRFGWQPSDDSIPSTILTLISVVCRLCHIGKRQSLPCHNIDKTNRLELLHLRAAMRNDG